MRLFSSIKIKLISSFVLIVIVALIGVGGIVGFRVYEQTKSEFMFSVEQQLKLIDMSIEHYMANIANNTQMLATMPLVKSVEDGITSYVNRTGPGGFIPMVPELGSPYEQEVYGVLDSFQRAHISVLNASLGAEVNGGFIKSPPAPRFDGYDARAREWYQSAVANKGKVFLSDLYTTSSNEFVVYSVMAVEDEQGALKGVISLDIDLTDLSDMIGEIVLGELGYVVLLDSKDTILAHPKNKALVGQSTEALALKGLSKGTFEPFVETIERPYWIKRHASSVPYFEIEYLVFIEESAFFKAAYSIIGDMIFIMFLIMCVAVFMAVLLSNRISKPIAKLKTITEAFSTGALDQRAEVQTHDEIGDLAATFNTLAERILLAKENLEGEVRARTSELMATLETLKTTQEQLIQSEKLAGLSTLVSGVAHEINTPLGIAITAISHLVDSKKSFDRKFESGNMKRSDLDAYLKSTEESTQIALKNLDRAKLLVHNFKQVSADQATESKRDFNVLTYTEAIVHSLMPKLKKRGHSIKINCSPYLSLKSYPGAFGQILTNLILNSIAHGFETDNPGMITLSYEEKDEHVTLLYQDNGIGMSTETLKRIFEPFFTTKRETGGTGLGLHIVYNIVTLQLRGHITCESKPGEGTTFTITFPADTYEGGPNDH